MTEPSLSRRTLVAGSVGALIAPALLAPPERLKAVAIAPQPDQSLVAPDGPAPTVERDQPAVELHVVVWPVDSADTRISDGFGPRVQPTAGASTFHPGVDFTPGYGAPVYAAASGVVVDVNGERAALGNHVEIRHLIDGVTYSTVYGHMAEHPLVEVGEHLELGHQLGIVGSTGVSTGPHLHFEVHDATGAAFDPLPWLRLMTAPR